MMNTMANLDPQAGFVLRAEDGNNWPALPSQEKQLSVTELWTEYQWLGFMTNFDDFNDFND